MRIALAAAVAAAAFTAAPTASAADLDPIETPELYRYFVALKGGYGPSLIDNDFESADGTGTDGRFEDDYIFGGSLEAGVFLSERFRLSAEVNYGRIEHDRQIINGRAFRLDGGTNLTQVFAKAAYEVPLADVGLTAPLFERTSIVALGGLGFTHINSGGTVRNVPLPTRNPARPFIVRDGIQNEEDTVFSAKVGLGTVYRLTENIDIVSETSFIFGSDAELTSNFGGGLVSTSDVETQAVVSQLGIRFKF